MMNRNYSNPKKLNTSLRHGQQTRKTSLNNWLGSTGFIEDFGKTVLRNCVRLHGPPGGDEPSAWRMRGGEPTASSNKTAPGKQRNSIRNKIMNIRGNTEIGNSNSFETHANSTMGDTTMQKPIGKVSLFNSRKLAVSAIALLASLGAVAPAYATIDNEATATGSFGGNPVTITSSPITQVPVANPNRDLDISKTVFLAATTGAGTSSTFTDGGDTISYRVTVTNSGNITETNIVINETNPTFDGVAGTGSYTTTEDVGAGTGTAASLAPGETVIFDVVYTLTDADAFNGAAAASPATSVVNVADADSDDFDMSVDSPGENASATTGIVPVPSLSIVKAYSFTTDPINVGLADVNDVIEYTYLVTNTGNVPISDVSISDDHENGEAGAAIFDSSTGTLGTLSGEWQLAVDTAATFGSNSDDSADGSYDSIGVGGAIEFTYIHTVTQAEFDAQ